SSTALSNPQFTPTLTGNYGLSLAVSDGTRTGNASFTVNAGTGFTSNGASSTALTSTGGVSTPVFTSTTQDLAGKPVVAWIDQGVGGGTVRVARCTANCTSANPTWVKLPDVDTGVGVMTWTGANDPRPVSVKVAPSGHI